MWMMVMFDLPVVSHEERKAATAFRLSLLDMGFEMAQYSVYLRFCTSPAQLETYANRVAACLPGGGRVSILQFTDKQYERIRSFKGRRYQPQQKPPDQFELF